MTIQCQDASTRKTRVIVQAKAGNFEIADRTPQLKGAYRAGLLGEVLDRVDRSLMISCAQGAPSDYLQ